MDIIMVVGGCNCTERYRLGLQLKGTSTSVQFDGRCRKNVTLCLYSNPVV